MGWGAAEAHATLPLHPNHAKTPACPNIQCRRVPRASFGFCNQTSHAAHGQFEGEQAAGAAQDGKEGTQQPTPNEVQQPHA